MARITKAMLEERLAKLASIESDLRTAWQAQSAKAASEIADLKDRLEVAKQKEGALLDQAIEALKNAWYWRGQYQNADAAAQANKQVALLLAISTMYNVSAPEAVAFVADNARVIGIDLTDRVLTATAAALSKAAGLVLESETSKIRLARHDKTPTGD